MNLLVMLSRAQFHGAIRMADPIHRVYWVIAVLVLLWLALGNLSDMILRFMDAPTHLIAKDIVSTQLPFPTVMVCPEVLFSDQKIEDFLAIMKYPEGMDASSIRPIIAQLAAFFSPDVQYTLLELSMVQQFLDYNDLNAEEAGLQLMTSCEDALIRCRYQQVDLKCDQIFLLELTQYGFCCVFNGRSLKREMSLHTSKGSGYSKLMTSQVGPASSLSMVINQSQMRQDSVDLSYKWLVVQSSERFVDTSKNGTPLSPGLEQWTAFWTKRLFVAEDLYFMSDELRGCRMDNKPLDYFPVYNKYSLGYRKNCHTECQMRVLMEQCRCLLPAHYRPFGTPICHPMNLPCARNALNVIFNQNYCDCPFTCDYEYEYTENSNYKMTSEGKPHDSLYDDLDLSNVTVLRVFVRSHMIASNVRRSYFSFHDLFSQLGGVFNVFFGCSILTLLELLQLAWYGLRYVKTEAAKTLVARTRKTTIKKKTTSFGSLCCCRVKTGRVKKIKVTKKKVTRLQLKKGIQTVFIE